jgi:hypothetical protein
MEPILEPMVSPGKQVPGAKPFLFAVAAVTLLDKAWSAWLFQPATL